MASLTEELIVVLEEELAVYQRLLPIAESKTKIIIDNDLEALQEITEQEQQFVGRIHALERRRDEVIIHIGTVLNRDPRTLNLSVLCTLLEKQPKERERLARLHDELRSVLERLKSRNEKNQALIQQSLELIEFNMNLIQSTRMSPGTNNYTKGAAESRMQSTRSGMFDTKR